MCSTVHFSVYVLLLAAAMYQLGYIKSDEGHVDVGATLTTKPSHKTTHKTVTSHSTGGRSTLGTSPGTKISSTHNATHKGNSTHPSSRVHSAGPPVSSTTDESAKRNIIIMVAVILLLVIVGIVCFVLLNCGSESGNPSVAPKG